jgi:hypothetical protein
LLQAGSEKNGKSAEISPLSGHGPAAGLRFELKMEVTCQHGGFFLLRLIWNIVGISPSGK